MLLNRKIQAHLSDTPLSIAEVSFSHHNILRINLLNSYFLTLNYQRTLAHFQ